MNIIGKRNIFLVFSGFLVLISLAALLLFGLNLSIEFTGGSRLVLSSKKEIKEEQTRQIKQIIQQQGIKVSTIDTSGNTVFVRTDEISPEKRGSIKTSLEEKIEGIEESEFESIGPTIGQETTQNAVKAVGIASLLIVFYIGLVFRKVPKPASGIRFGVTAIVALIHDVVIVLGLFAVLGRFWNVQIDSMFVTAILTVIGFSVHDTIVVFDRIRENLLSRGGENFAAVANDSIVQTLGRSINTSLTLLLVLFSLLFFGGESLRWFTLALFVGVVSGTYSSIFVASPLLVVWQNLRKRRK